MPDRGNACAALFREAPEMQQEKFSIGKFTEINEEIDFDGIFQMK